MKKIFILFSCIALISCGLIEINGVDYSSLTRKEKQHVLKCDKPIDSLRCDGYVYQINVEQMKKYLQNHEDVIVYQYSSFCASDDCISPYAAEKISNIFGFDFCIVADVYTRLFWITNIESPILTIDFNIYNTQNWKKLSRRFYDELTGVTKDEHKWYRFLYFRRGEYVCSYGSLKEAQYVLRKSYDVRTSKMLDDFFK